MESHASGAADAAHHISWLSKSLLLLCIMPAFSAHAAAHPDADPLLANGLRHSAHTIQRVCQDINPFAEEEEISTVLPSLFPLLPEHARTRDITAPEQAALIHDMRLLLQAQEAETASEETKQSLIQISQSLDLVNSEATCDIGRTRVLYHLWTTGCITDAQVFKRRALQFVVPGRPEWDPVCTFLLASLPALPICVGKPNIAPAERDFFFDNAVRYYLIRALPDALKETLQPNAHAVVQEACDRVMETVIIAQRNEHFEHTGGRGVAVKEAFYKRPIELLSAGKWQQVLGPEEQALLMPTGAAVSSSQQAGKKALKPAPDTRSIEDLMREINGTATGPSTYGKKTSAHQQASKTPAHRPGSAAKGKGRPEQPAAKSKKKKNTAPPTDHSAAQAPAIAQEPPLAPAPSGVCAIDETPPSESRAASAASTVICSTPSSAAGTTRWKPENGTYWADMAEEKDEPTFTLPPIIGATPATV